VSDANAGEAYGRLIEDQLNQERQSKISFENRGVTVINTSSALATLLFALTASLTLAAKFKLPEPARLPLILALGTFVLAAICGLATNMPIAYGTPTPDSMAKLCTSDYWDAPATTGQLRLAETQIEELRRSLKANGFKANFLIAAIGCEILATGFLAWAIGVIIYSA
jgi:hypothetical protein